MLRAYDKQKLPALETSIVRAMEELTKARDAVLIARRFWTSANLEKIAVWAKHPHSAYDREFGAEDLSRLNVEDLQSLSYATMRKGAWARSRAHAR